MREPNPIYSPDMAPAVSRTAGMLCLVIIASGLLSELFVRARLIVDGDVAATAANILASISLFRIGIVTDSIMLLSDVEIAVFFYVLLKPANGTLSLMAAAFRLTQASILGLKLGHDAIFDTQHWAKVCPPRIL